MSLEHWWAWGINCFSRKPVPTFEQPHSKEKFRNIQSKPHLTQLCAFFHCLPGRKAWHLPLHFLSSEICREQWGHLSASIFFPKWTTQVLSASPGRTWHDFQPFYQLRWSPLDTFKYLNIFFFFSSCLLEPRATKNVQDEAKPTLNAVRESFLLTGCLCYI